MSFNILIVMISWSGKNYLRWQILDFFIVKEVHMVNQLHAL